VGCLVLVLCWCVQWGVVGGDVCAMCVMCAQACVEWREICMCDHAWSRRCVLRWGCLWCRCEYVPCVPWGECICLGDVVQGCI